MRKTLICALILLLTVSCIPTTYMQSYFVDLSKYNDKGFFVTLSNSVAFNYEPIGIMETEGRGAKIEDNRYIPLTATEVLDKFVADCKTKGADAVIDLKITHSVKSNKNKFYIKGMAIKRK